MAARKWDNEQRQQASEREYARDSQGRFGSTRRVGDTPKSLVPFPTVPADEHRRLI